MGRQGGLAAACAVFLGAYLLAVAAAMADERSPGAAAELRRAGVVPGQYIVVFRNEVHDPIGLARGLARAHGFQARFVYTRALKGFSAQLPPQALAALQRNPRVDFIEPDQTVHTFDQVTPTGIQRVFAPANANLWMNGTDDRRVDVDVAVIDTGIDHTHPDLHVVARADCTGDSPFNQSCTDGSGTDGSGHGTHVAGTIAAIDNGIGVVGMAPGARLWAVKVLRDDGSGYMSWIIAGVDWVTGKVSEGEPIRVANMSLGCECSSAALDRAIASSVGAGVSYVVAAGNNTKDAETFSPANHPDVITVSALADFDGLPGGEGMPTCRSDTDDALANFSNFGAVVDIAAPGVCILSTWPGGGYTRLSGTSMAAPHVAGAAALLATNGYGPEEIRALLAGHGNLDWTDTSGDGIHEPLLDVSNQSDFVPVLVAGTEGQPDLGDGVPSVLITAPADGARFDVGAEVTFEGSASDPEDGALSQWLVWSSDLVEQTIGEGASFTTDALPEGEHRVTAAVSDEDGNEGSSTVRITIGSAPQRQVAEIAYSTSGGRNNDRHLTVTVHVIDQSGLAAAGVPVSVLVINGSTSVEWTGTSQTGTNGSVDYTLNNIASGCYRTEVTRLGEQGTVETPENEYCK
jgi:hypothetical protein